DSSPLQPNAPASVTAPKVRPEPRVSTRVRAWDVLEFATETASVYSIVSPCSTVLPVAGWAVLDTVVSAGTTMCSVVHVVQAGSGSPPGGLLATTLLPTVPVASASTVAV